MVCKDCIHYDVCEEKDTQYTGLPFSIANDKPCKFFKDKSRFIELPCKFLQKCFVIPTIENNLSDITEMKCIGFSLSYKSYNANLITDKNKLYQPCFGAFCKTIFFTKEEVEAKLKEYNNELKRCPITT